MEYLFRPLLRLGHPKEDQRGVHVKADKTGVETSNVKMSMNPFDEISVEEAIRMKESGVVEEIIIVSIGVQQCQETIRTGLAMGADRGIHVKSDEDLEPLAIAKILKHLVEKESPKVVILGKQAIDDDSNQTGQMLAALLGWSQGTFASKIEFNGDKANITREIDSGLENIEVSLPTILTVDLRLNEPRYASLPNIMKAKKKPIDEFTPDELNVDTKPRLETLSVEEPPVRQAGVMVESVTALVEKLKNEARVI